MKAFSKARFDVERSAAPLRLDIHDLGRRRGSWYRERCDFGTRTWFAIRFATRMIVRDMFCQAYIVCTDLDRHINDIIAGRYFYGLTGNAAFETYEEEIPLQEPISPLNIFAHERGGLRRML